MDNSQPKLPIGSLQSSDMQSISALKILIVDDAESDRVTYSRYLQSDLERTYRIIEAETLEEGLELWRSHQPDIVLIDLNLPDGDGMEFIEAIKGELAGEKAPVIMLTGQGNEKMAVKTMKSGAADYLVKGDITAKSLTTTVKQIPRETLLSRQLGRAQQQQILISEIALRIRESLNLEDISKAIVKEVRQFISADRAAIYQFNPEMSGTIVAEDIVSPWQPCLNVQIEDTCFRGNLGGAYCEGRVFVANDIYAANLTACHIQLLERFQVRANLVVPILLPNLEQQTLWGLLILHQCSAPRVWLESDIHLLQQLSVQLAIAIRQAIAYQQVQTELAERKRAEQELLQLNQSLEAKVTERTQELWQVNQLQRVILDGTDYAIISTDLNGIIQTFNAGAEKMLGYSMDELVGKVTPKIFFDRQEVIARITSVVPELGQDILGGRELFSELLSIAVQGKLSEEWISIRKDGSHFPSEISVTVLKDNNGQPIGFLSIRKDISDRTQAELQLQKTTDRLALALKSGAIGCWELNLANYIIVWDERAYELHGIPLGTDVTADTWASTVHPDDLQSIQALFNRAIAGESEFDTEYRVIHPDQSIHFIKGYGVIERDIDGNPMSMIGVNFDISTSKFAEQALKQQLATIEAAIDGIAILQENKYIYLNQSHLEIFGYERPDEILGKTWTALYSSEELTRFEQEVFPVLQRDHSWQGGAIATRKDGSTFDEELSLTITADGLLICVCRDISDRKRSEAQLLQANEELLRATKLKDEFLANMSHELRTPLNSILGLSEALQDQVLGVLNEKQLNAIGIIESSGKHLLSLINDILDLSKISSGMMELDIASVSVRNLCDSSLVFVKQQAFQKRIQVVSNIPPYINNINIVVDERRIKQVLVNLLTNAVKFTPNEGKISLLVAVGSGETWQGEATIPQRLRAMNSSMIVFQVVDTGIGIASNNLPRLFQPFVQVDSALNRQYEGTGLGLALVKQIVELHGGQVIAESEVGKGSRFTVVLPYEMAPSNPKSEQTALALSSLEINSENAIAPLILLAEDNEANVQTFASYLTAINYRIAIARNGEEAVAMAKSESPDIILMDIQMPNMDGLEAIRLIRADETTATIPIIALTALAMEGDRKRCLEVGANEYLSKPVKLRQLNTVIQQILASF